MSRCAEQKTKDLATLATIMATARQTSLENEHCHYFAIIPSCSHFTMLARNPTTGLVCAPLINQISRPKDFFVCSSCHQNSKLGNFALLFYREQHGLVRKCVLHVQHVYIFPQSTNQILNLCHCRCRCCR